MPSTHFSICVVVDETEKTKTIVNAPMLRRINFYRTDLLEEARQPPKCALGKVIGYKGMHIIMHFQIQKNCSNINSNIFSNVF